MKLFPYILVRIAGLPFEILEQLSLQSKFYLNDLTTKWNEVNDHKTGLLQILDNASNEFHSGFVLKNLAYLKTNILHGKKGKLSGKLESNLSEKEKLYFKKINDQLNLYHQESDNLTQLENDFEAFYDKEISNHRKFLQQISNEPIILNGLLMSSHSFLHQLQKYSLKEVKNFAKKQFQTERTFLKYLARTCLKTSPFSTFSPLSVIKISNEDKFEITPKSMFRLNNYIFALWRDALNNYPPFYRKLACGLNPSLEKKDNLWDFLINTRNIESIQKMENNGMLEFIFDTFKSRGEEVIFQHLVEALLPLVETDLKSLESYLLELIDYGFLEWRWAFSALDPFWNEKLKHILEASPDHQYLMDFSVVLANIQQKINEAEKATFLDRKRIQNEAFELIKKTSESILKETQLIEKEQVVNTSQIKKIKTQSFGFTPEKLFYEDVTIPFKTDYPTSEISKVISELDEVLNCLDVLHFDALQEKLKQFFKNSFKKEEAISLLSFYEAFYKEDQQIDLISEKIAIENRLSWQTEIIRHSTLSEDGILNISLQQLNSLSQKTKGAKHTDYQKTRGAFIQFFHENNLLKGYSETAFEGNGKMMGRFLHLLPPEVTESLISWNEAQRNELVWIENVDGSIYNPNLHPPLLPFEIRMPGSQNTLPIENQISVDELVVVFNELEDQLNLIHKKTNKRCYVFDMGFEALESRSPLYQMLAIFGYASTSQSILAGIVNDYFYKKAENGMNFQPRICVENRLIIQRKRWIFPINLLPFKQNNESEATYFIKINRWIQDHQIPSKVFVTISYSELQERGKEKTDHYKPQYIDFKSPVFVQLFHKLIKKVSSNLKIEEVLPFPEEVRDGKKYATEYLVQWQADKQ